MSDKMREEFEAAVQLAFHQAGNVADLRKVNGQYIEEVHRSAWWGWKSSRSALVIELPEPERDSSGYQLYTPRVVRECIKAAGLKVNPFYEILPEAQP